MKVPQNLKKILQKNEEIDGIVTYTISQFGQILSENNLYFFEDYTDHGIRHIESILESSNSIITETTYSEILDKSPSSVGIFILSVIPHDIGMHLTPEGFKALIFGKHDHIRIKDLDNQTWRELWEDFLDEARRYGDKEKLNIIGNSNWSFRIPDIEDRDKLDGMDRKLIGEFIRKNHPRIAHEISIIGFPTKDKNLPFASDLDYELRNLCGLLARSHGKEIRSFFLYLENLYQDTWSKPYNVELIFLMVVLRIADYFQIDRSRNLEIAVKLKRLSVPISEIEHYKHLDVKYVQQFNKDPETLIVQAEPRNSLIFIKLSKLFEDIQKELDKSWAILGEIYGKEPKEKQASITYRRIKSNIDNAFEFGKRVTYIPEEIAFKASSELPKLLISPLYGDDPTYGIRELLQNSVDSCREREFLEGDSYNGKVIITFFKNENELFLQIKDNGLGMPLHILKHYFLEVGSSLRKSSLWKKEFTDIEGHSKIQRSGKFGIGVLAAFLIGEKISVHTKSSSSQIGFSFETNLNNDQIEIEKLDKKEIGTTIIIPIDKTTIEKLKKSKNKFDKWYTQMSPKIIFEDKLKVFDSLGHKNYAPGFNDELPNGWYDLPNNEFNKVIWTYNSNFVDKNNKSGILTCNGILVPGKTWETLGNSYASMSLPYISVFDFDGKLTLDLSRNRIDGNVPFEKELITEVFNEAIAKLLLYPIHSPFQEKIFSTKNPLKFEHPSFYNSLRVIYSKNGFILNTNYFTEKNKAKPLLKFSTRMGCEFPQGFNAKDAFIEFLEKDDVTMSSYSYNVNLNTLSSGGKLFLDRSLYDKLFDLKKNRYPMPVKRHHKLLNENEDFVEISYGFDNGIFELNDLSNTLNSCNYVMETLVNEVHNIAFEGIQYFNRQLQILLNNEPVIPYDIADRKSLFASAFSKLEKYLH